MYVIKPSDDFINGMVSVYHSGLKLNFHTLVNEMYKLKFI